MTSDKYLPPRLAEEHARERAKLYALTDAIGRQFVADRVIAARGLAVARTSTRLNRIGEGRV